MNAPDALVSSNQLAVRPERPPHQDHIVRFYEREETLFETVSEFLSEGLLLGQAAIVIAVEGHRDAMRFALASRGVDVNSALRTGQLVLLDAHEMLATFMRDGMPDEALFRQHIGGAIENMLVASTHSRMRAFGEMVDILWREGNSRAAIRLEEHWNDLAEVHSFALICAYAIGNFYGTADRSGFDAICHQHGRVMHAEVDPLQLDTRVLYEDHASLRQRADAFEAEIEQRKALEAALREALADRRRAEEALRRDIEERERVEHELRRAKEEAERANRVKAEFLAVMSHELRTPLNAIIGYQQLLSDGIGGAPTDQQLQHLDRIGSSAHHLLHLIDDVLSVARIDAGSVNYHIEPVSVNDVFRVVAEMVEPQLTHKDLHYRQSVADDLRVYVDREKLQQILLNLVGNAIKFTPVGGTLHVSATVEPTRPSVVLLQVADTGIGIPADKLETIFERFVQLDTGPTRLTGGAGLGLAISRDLARALGGDLSVHSVPGEGSTFTITLRRAPASLEQSP